MPNWYNTARVGLFIHWGINTENPDWENHIPRFKTCAEFEDAATAAGWNAAKWIDAAVKLKASYITLATFHSCLGYIKSWRSEIPGTYTAKRDFLGELIAEANKYNIKILLYLSGDSSGRLFYPENPWIFPEKYKEHKNNPDIDILDFGIWQKVYVKEIIGELIVNYPDLAGFWFDGWNRDGITKEIFEFIHSENPGLINIKNNFTDSLSDGEDVMSLECFGKVFEPSFDYVSGCWVPPHGKECCYVMRELSDWWQYYEPGEYDKNSLLRKFITITANGWVAKMGLGPNLSGDFNGNLGKFIGDVADYLSWASPSIFGTQAGGLALGYQNDGAYTVCCHTDDKYFIHTLLPPKGGTLLLPDGGLEFSNASNLKTGALLSMSQKDGLLFITADFRKYCESDGDFVIALTKSGDKRRALSVSEYLSPLPRDVTLKTDGEIRGIIITEDETSAVSKGGWAAPENNRARDYILYAGFDDGTGVRWEKISSGALSGARGDKQINFSPISPEYIKLRIENAYNTTDGYLKKFVGVTWEYSEYENNAQIPEPLKEVVLENGTKFICDGGDVCGWADNGGNVYVVSKNAAGVNKSADGKLLAVMPPESGKLRIKEIKIIRS
jgi:alpha-L-fucosidase